MLAARQRAGCAARQLQRNLRTYASNSHGPSQPTNETFGTGSLLAVGAFFGTALFFQFGPKEGEDSAISRFIGQYSSKAEDWAEMSAVHTRANQQAGYDKNLFENTWNKQRYVDVTYPEAFTSHAPRNIQAGQLRHLDDVVEHYREKQAKEEERKAKKLAQE